MKTILISLLFVSIATAVFAQENPSIERWDRSVCLHTEKMKNNGNPSYASAFLVQRDESTYLVTANHAARDTDGRTKLLYRTADGESKWLYLAAITNASSNPWQTYENADIAVLLVDPTQAESKPYLDQLRKLSIEFDTIRLDAPSRTTDIEITGFPVGIGTIPPISPLAMKGSIASREMLADAQWGAEAVLYAVPIVGAGCSGGPVFRCEFDPMKTDLVGMYIGMVYDPSGVKLSKIVPSRIIRQTIDAMRTTSTKIAK
ncbi:MAG: serine protease [Planctomycetota bacterium]